MQRYLSASSKPGLEIEPSGTTAGSSVGKSEARRSSRNVSRRGAGADGVKAMERVEGVVPCARAGSVVLPMASEAKRATLQDSKLGKSRRFTRIGKMLLEVEGLRIAAHDHGQGQNCCVALRWIQPAPRRNAQ